MNKKIFSTIFLFFFLLSCQNKFNQDSFKLSGELIGKVKKAGQSEWKIVLHQKNLVVNVGLAQIALHLGDGSATAWTHMAIGTGTTTPSGTDTALGNEVARVSATFSRVTTDVTNDTAQWVATFTASGTWAITEQGMFTASSGGIMLNRVTFSAINLSTNDELQFTYKLDID